jgi:hypothetical protein
MSVIQQARRKRIKMSHDPRYKKKGGKTAARKAREMAKAARMGRTYGYIKK